MGAREKLMIPFDSIEDHLNCSVCLSVIRGAVLTPCGHRYCTKCITEWVERNHTCPCCNSALQTNHFYCDVQFDAFTDVILAERDKAEQNYFDVMFGTATQDALQGSKPPSSFEKIVKDHIKTSLMSHQKYFDRLRQDCQRKINLLDSGLGLHQDSQDNADSTAEAMKTLLKKNLEESEKLAAESYDRYLTDHLPTLDILPVSVSVYIADKDVRIPNVLFHPIDRLSSIKTIVEDSFKERGDEVISWEKDSGVRLLFSPLSKKTIYDIDRTLETIDKLDDVHQLSWDSQPFFQCHMRPGSEIVLKNVLKSQSDQPKQCFADLYHVTGPHAVDYYTCDSCRFKWICKSCIQSCHSGHDVSLFVNGHTPTWACCYCPKKNACKLKGK